MQSNEGDHRVSGTNKADSGSNMSCGNSDSCRSGMAVLPTNAVCDDSQQPTDKWDRFGARPKTKPGPVKRTPREPSLDKSLTCGLPDAAHVPVDSSERGIDEEFLARHSRDRSLLESLRHSSIENELTSDASLPGASYMESMMNYIEADRIKPHAVDDEVASRPDERNRLSLPLPMRQDERGYAVGGSNQSLNGTTGPDCTQNSDHLPNASMGNMAHVAAAGSSNGALNGVLSEAESIAAHPYGPGNACNTCNLLNPAGDQDSTPNSARAQARREAVIRASTEETTRGPSSCSGPVEHSCVCLETDGCRVHGTIVPETCQRDPAHDKCCKCLQDVFIGFKILPCSHPVHTECLVSMIVNDELICPLCGRAFLGRG